MRKDEPLFLTNSSRTTMRVTISPQQGARVALRLLWDSLMGIAKRGRMVTFEISED